ncbi:MAG: 16S rRNA (uracil(1498)-N(3))-methyltransferase [Desulfuromonadales bacterium]
MNLILLLPEDFRSTTTVHLTGRRLAHVRQVHRAAVGDTLRVGVLDGAIGSGTVTRLGPAILEMSVKLTEPPPAPLPVTLLLALPRPKVLKRVLQGVTALGIKRLVLLNSYRVEKSYWQSPVLKDESLSEQVILGLEQARDTVLPEILQRRRFKPFVEDELTEMAAGTLSLVAHPGAASESPPQADKPVTLAVGPEGGFIPYEVEKLIECGFRPISLGERILRVETAVPALLGRLFQGAGG